MEPNFFLRCCQKNDFAIFELFSIIIIFTIFVAERGQRVIVDFPSGYDIEEAEDCKYDWLIFQDGPFFFSPIINKLCGSQDNMTSINSTGRYMRLWFRTDDFIENSGFRLNIRYEPIPGELDTVSQCVD